MSDQHATPEQGSLFGLPEAPERVKRTKLRKDAPWRKKIQARLEERDKEVREQLGFLPEISEEEEKALLERAKRLRMKSFEEGFGVGVLKEFAFTEKGEPGEPLNDYEWSPEVCMALHEEVMHETLSFIGDSRCRRRLWQDIYDWVSTKLDYKESLVIQKPFSFEACCLACGYDAEFLQQAILEQMRKDVPNWKG